MGRGHLLDLFESFREAALVKKADFDRRPGNNDDELDDPRRCTNCRMGPLEIFFEMKFSTDIKKRSIL